jgi:putative PIN family toxin of toxin-antitoxin system
MAKVVVAANVLISSVFGGLPLKAINLALSHHEVFYSEDIENELNGVLQKLEAKLKNNQLQKLQENMSRFLSFCRKISVTENLSICRDRKDDRYLSLCKQVSADFLITGDKDLLTISKELLQKNNLTSNIISPAEFVRQKLLQGKSRA